MGHYGCPPTVGPPIIMEIQMCGGEGGLGRVIASHGSANSEASSSKLLLGWCPATAGMPLVLGNSLPNNTVFSILGGYTVVLSFSVRKNPVYGGPLLLGANSNICTADTASNLFQLAAP